MEPEAIKSEELVCIEDPPEVLEEVHQIILLIFPQFDFNPVQNVFKDIVRLFSGKYIGFRKCNIMYHDLTHTTDCLLATARLMHGAFINGIIFKERNVTCGLISALMHDTGYIQSVEDHQGTGAKYTLVHINRSIEFMEKYFLNDGYSLEDFRLCCNFLKCTGLDVKIDGIQFESPEQEIIGRILGTADLIGQMADKNYLKKLPFLYHEFKEGGVTGFADQFDLMKKTPSFWEIVKKRLAMELGQVDRYMRDHFRVRWGIDQDLYREAIERNIDYLKFLLENNETDENASNATSYFLKLLTRKQ